MGKKSTTNDPAQQPEFPGFRVHVPIVKVPQPDGSLLIKTGKPQILGAEISTAEAADILGLSQRRVAYLCEIGHYQTANQPSGPGGKWFISHAEIIALKNPENSGK